MGEVLSLYITINGSFSACYPPYLRIGGGFLTLLSLVSKEELLFLVSVETLSLSSFVSRFSVDLSRTEALALL